MYQLSKEKNKQDNIDIINKDIEAIDKRIELTQKSLLSVALDDYNTLTNMQSVLNRMQGEKTSLLKLKHSIEQDINVKNEETSIKIEKLKAEIDRLASGGDLSKIDLLIASLDSQVDEENIINEDD